MEVIELHWVYTPDLNKCFMWNILKGKPAQDITNLIVHVNTFAQEVAKFFKQALGTETLMAKFPHQGRFIDVRVVFSLEHDHFEALKQEAEYAHDKLSKDHLQCFNNLFEGFIAFLNGPKNDPNSSPLKDMIK